MIVLYTCMKHRACQGSPLDERAVSAKLAITRSSPQAVRTPHARCRLARRSTRDEDHDGDRHEQREQHQVQREQQRASPGVDRSGHDKSFDVPQLRGIARTAPYFHDNMRATLREVIDDYSRFVWASSSRSACPATLPSAKGASARR